jgi:hypothetical protein
VRNSFCFDSKDATPLGVISPREGVRDRDVDDVKVRKAFTVEIELEARATRRASIVVVVKRLMLGVVFVERTRGGGFEKEGVELQKHRPFE